MNEPELLQRSIEEPESEAVHIKMKRLRWLQVNKIRYEAAVKEGKMKLGLGKQVVGDQLKARAELRRQSADPASTVKRRVPPYLFELFHHLSVRNIQRMREKQSRMGCFKQASYRQWNKKVHSNTRARIHQYLLRRDDQLQAANKRMERELNGDVEETDWNIVRDL